MWGVLFLSKKWKRYWKKWDLAAESPQINPRWVPLWTFPITSLSVCLSIFSWLISRNQATRWVTFCYLPPGFDQEPIKWSLHMCCTFESTHFRKELFFRIGFPAKLMCFRGHPHITLARKKWRRKREIGQQVYSLFHHRGSCFDRFCSRKWHNMLLAVLLYF